MTVKTEAGYIQGTQQTTTGGSAEVFLGIPYAAPPVGALRWAAPVSAEPWQGVRDGTRFAAICPQGKVGNEDCLYVNVYRPAGTGSRASLPVMAYFHGGGSTGTANTHDATRMANENGIVVVVFNYRLGALGLLNHPAISSGAAGGNYGLLDAKAALSWVQRNISAFGGNPTNVTLASESSGSTNTCRLLVDPSTAGLFHAAIISSDDCIRDVDTPPEALVRPSNLVRQVGCTEAANVGSCLRSKTSAELAAVVGQGPQGSGWNLTAAKSAAASIAAGEWLPVPILLGSTREEGRSSGTPYAKFTPQDYQTWVTRLVGPANAPAVMANYPANKYTGPYAIPYVVGDVITDSGMRGLGGCPNVSLAKSLSRQTPTFYYQFEDSKAPSPSSPPGYEYLASHASELPYLWGFATQSVGLPPFTDAQRQLSTEMIRYWGAFAKNHEPSVPGQAPWPRVEDAGGSMMSLRPGGASQVGPLATFEDTHKCAFWATMPVILERGEI